MVCVHFDGIEREWVVQYRLEGVAVRTVRTRSVEIREQWCKQFLAHDKAVACGAKLDLVSLGGSR